MKKVSLYFLSLVAVGAMILTFSSCGESEDPVTAPSAFTYPATDVQVGSPGTVSPSGTNSGVTYSFANASTVPDFITLNSSTGTISVAAESIMDSYNIAVNATNSAGFSSSGAAITIVVPDAFNPIGKKFVVAYFINQEANLELEGLDNLVPGVPNLLTLPVGWPGAGLTPEELFPYTVLTGLGDMLYQVPSDLVCEALGDGNKGDTTLIIVNADLTLSTECSEGGPPEDNIGVSTITYANDEFIFTIELVFTDLLPAIPYPITGAVIADFDDPLAGVTYEALMGTVEGFTLPLDYTSDATMQDPTKWGFPEVDVVFRVVE